ncbi:MAG TPA: hypothetical protein PKC68_00855 [Alphaproteobacteria bacterium]|nr:hypothetical protein [Alphaproteobacteria bacterium]
MSNNHPLPVLQTAIQTFTKGLGALFTHRQFLFYSFMTFVAYYAVGFLFFNIAYATWDFTVMDLMLRLWLGAGFFVSGALFVIMLKWIVKDELPQESFFKAFINSTNLKYGLFMMAVMIALLFPGFFAFLVIGSPVWASIFRIIFIVPMIFVLVRFGLSLTNCGVQNQCMPLKTSYQHTKGQTLNIIASLILVCIPIVYLADYGLDIVGFLLKPLIMAFIALDTPVNYLFSGGSLGQTSYLGITIVVLPLISLVFLLLTHLVAAFTALVHRHVVQESAVESATHNDNPAEASNS